MDPFWLTIISGLLMLVFLIALGVMVIAIGNALRDVTDTLENINMGVRAIEQETDPLEKEVARLNATFELLDNNISSIVNRAAQTTDESDSASS